MRRIAVAAALCFAVACGTDPAAPPADAPVGIAPAPPGSANASATCVNTVAGDSKFRKHPSWVCGSRIRVVSTNSAISAEIPAAIAIWNSVYGHDGLPVFVTTASPTPAFTVDISMSGSTGQYYCGVTNLSTRDITIYRSASLTSCAGATATNNVLIGDLDELIAHELSHSIGFGHLSENGSIAAANHCVASLPSGGGLNGRLCQIERLHVLYYYGMYDTYVEPGTFVATSLEVSGPSSAGVGETKTLTAFPSWDGAAPAVPRYSWSSTNTGVAQTSGTTVASNVVTAVAPGSTTIRARLTGSTVLLLNPQSGDFPFTVNPPAPPPPTGLNATSVTYNSALIRWTNGAADATTNLYYRRSGQATWTDSVTGIAAGTTSRQLTGLSSVATYEVRAKHVRSGVSSTFTSTIQFTTTAPPLPTISNFVVANCRRELVGSKWFNHFTMTWSATPTQPTGGYQIAMHTTNNIGLAAIILTVNAPSQTGEVGGYLESPTVMNRYFWVRYSGAAGGTSWLPLTGNPLATNQCLK